MERPETEKHGGSRGEKICLITGATSGIGKATAMGLANMGASVVMVGRDQGKGEAVMAEIKEKSTNASVDLMLADLSSQEEIHRLAGEFKEAYPQIDVLINNAGLFRSKRITTADGKAEARSSDVSYDERIARRLWEVSADLTNLPA